MPTKSIPISQATSKELLGFARNTYGLELKDGLPPDTIIKALKEAGYNEPHIDVEIAIPTVAKTKEAPRSDRPPQRILINAEKGPGGGDDVKVGVNGVFYAIQRGVEAVVPWEVAHALRNAKEQAMIQGENDEIIGRSDVFSYPVSFLGPASEAA